MPATASELFRHVRRELIEASETGLLENPPYEIFGRVKLIREQRYRLITGGDKNFERSRDLAHFARPDGFWFDFTITLTEDDQGLALIAYAFELRFPAEGPIQFVRFDLDPPDQAHEDDGLRCHMHPGSDDIRLPAPLLAPLELLDVFLQDVRLTDRPRT